MREYTGFDELMEQLVEQFESVFDELFEALKEEYREENHMSRLAYVSWFDRLSFHSVEMDEDICHILLRDGNQAQKEYVEHKYLPWFEEKIFLYTGVPYALKLDLE